MSRCDQFGWKVTLSMPFRCATLGKLFSGALVNLRYMTSMDMQLQLDLHKNGDP